jgi:maleate isomerase
MENKRIGIIIPSSNTTVEDEFSPVLLKAGISVHYDRIPLENVTVEDLASMEKNTKNAAALLKTAEVKLVAYACTTGSLFKGLGHDIELGKLISKEANSEAVVTSGGVVDALQSIKAKNIKVITPYIKDLNELESKFLEENGFNIMDIKGMNKVKNLDIGKTTSDELIDFIDGINMNDTDCLFLSCTNLPTFSVINLLEDKLKKPVISSNSATLWSILKVLKISDVKGPGCIFNKV